MRVAPDKKRREKATTSVPLLPRISSEFASTLVKTRSPTCRDHVEKQTQKSPEPCSGKCVAVAQRPYEMSGASAWLPWCIVGLVVRDTAEHITSRVAKQGAGTTRQLPACCWKVRNELARSQLQKDWLHRTGTADAEATSHHHR